MDRPSTPQNGAIKIGDVTLGNVSPAEGVVAPAALRSAQSSSCRRSASGRSGCRSPRRYSACSRRSRCSRARAAVACGAAPLGWRDARGLPDSVCARAEQRQHLGQVRITWGQAGFNPPSSSNGGRLGNRWRRSRSRRRRDADLAAGAATPANPVTGASSRCPQRAGHRARLRRPGALDWVPIRLSAERSPAPGPRRHGSRISW